MNFPYLITDNKKINTAYRLAVATLATNIFPFKDGILEKAEPVIIAGLGYCTPWTRDASINTWNAGGLICPSVALNTLKSVLVKNENGYFIEGEYWDRIIWAVGAWWQYVYTGDKEFLKIAYEAVENSLAYFEETEFSTELNLFRGPACYGDGIAAYPDVYARHGKSGILDFVRDNKELCEQKGVGIPIYALSTNCLYYEAYVLADQMGAELGKNAKYIEKADAMKKAINDIFWSGENKTYKYIYDKFGGCDAAEGMGLSFAVLFDIANEEQKREIFKNTPVSEHGITCVYPSFPRYDTPDGYGRGRHSGTVWPHIQGFWADAAAASNEKEIFDKEFSAQTENANRYYQFAEIYHPVTGEMYGGLQEDKQQGVREWRSEPFQTWSATAYLRNVYFDILGMKFTLDGITFKPVGSSLANKIVLKGLKYRNAFLNISISGMGESIASFKVNGNETVPFLSANASGTFDIEISTI